MSSNILAGIITLLTPILTEVIKKVVPDNIEKTFKRFIPVIPPLLGSVLGYAGEKFGFTVLPELSNAVTGLFLGTLSSSGYDIMKAQKRKK